MESDRRPLASRDMSWAKALAKLLARSQVHPNQVSLMSMVFALMGGLSIYVANGVNELWLKGAAYVLAIVGIQGRLLCNLLDGMLAIEGGQKTKSGGIYNEFPDRVSDVIIFMGAGAAVASDQTFLFSGLTWGWAASLVAVTTAYIRAMGASLGAPHFFTGPMAKPHRMALLTCACLFNLIGTFMEGTFSFLPIALVIATLGGIATCVRRLTKIRNFLEHSTPPSL